MCTQGCPVPVRCVMDETHTPIQNFSLPPPSFGHVASSGVSVLGDNRFLQSWRDVTPVKDGQGGLGGSLAVQMKPSKKSRQQFKRSN